MSLEDMREEIQQQLAISSDLAHEFTAQAAYFARWAFLHARAQDKVRQLEEQVELLFALLYSEYRAKHKDAKENDCKSFIRKSNEHKLLNKRLRAAKLQCDVLRASVRAFEMRRDMLIQLGAQFRAEYESAGMGAPKPTKRSREDKVRKASSVVRKAYRTRRSSDGSESTSSAD